MADESALPAPGDIVAGKYRIERPIGAGGMGAVFEVTHRVTGKRFALKWLLPTAAATEDAAKRFIREAQVAGRFEHPNVVEVYDVGQERGSLYMVMTLLEGESLAARLDSMQRLTVAETLRILIPCMRAVTRAHQAGIVHRDLKPANIFLCRATDHSPEHPKVLDFGISKMTNVGEIDSTITKTGMVMGTPHYMSPEQLRGVGVDRRTDVYGFGVILYQLLSGELPFPADSFSALVLQIATEIPKPLNKLMPGLPAGLVQLVERAMARDANDRFQQLDELVQALEPFCGENVTTSSPAARRLPELSQPARHGTLVLDTPLSSEPNASLQSPDPGPRRLRWVVSAAAAALVMLGIIVAKLIPGTNEDAAGRNLRALPDSDRPSAALLQPLTDAATLDQRASGAAANEDEPHPKTIPDPDAPAARKPEWRPPLVQTPGSVPSAQPPVANAPSPPHTRLKPARSKPAPAAKDAPEPLGF